MKPKLKGHTHPPPLPLADDDDDEGEAEDEADAPLICDDYEEEEEEEVPQKHKSFTKAVTKKERGGGRRGQEKGFHQCIWTNEMGQLVCDQRAKTKKGMYCEYHGTKYNGPTCE